MIFSNCVFVFDSLMHCLSLRGLFSEYDSARRGTDLFPLPLNYPRYLFANALRAGELCQQTKVKVIPYTQKAQLSIFFLQVRLLAIISTSCYRVHSSLFSPVSKEKSLPSAARVYGSGFHPLPRTAVGVLLLLSTPALLLQH